MDAVYLKAVSKLSSSFLHTWSLRQSLSQRQIENDHRTLDVYRESVRHHICIEYSSFLGSTLLLLRGVWGELTGSTPLEVTENKSAKNTA